MRTSKPISTISYNTTDFLIDTLQRLKYLKLIEYYEFIVHLPDNDDKKQHIHLYIEPNKVIDTESFSSYFNEFSFSCFVNRSFIKSSSFFRFFKSNRLFIFHTYKWFLCHHIKPLKCINWQNSKFGDWYWYALHDKDYLKAKMLERNCYYKDEDIFTCDYDTHCYKVSENPLINYANMSDIALRDYIFKCVADGYSLNYLLNTCVVPLGKIQSVIHFYNALASHYSPNYNKDKEFQQELAQKRLNNLQETCDLILSNDAKPIVIDELF